MLHALLAGTAVAGVLLVLRGRLSTAELVTLFLVTTTFVGQIDQIARHLPDLQAGLGALARLRTMLHAEPEPVGGRAVPSGPLDLQVRSLSFSYAAGPFALRDIELDVPAGQTLALVGHWLPGARYDWIGLTADGRHLLGVGRPSSLESTYHPNRGPSLVIHDTTDGAIVEIIRRIQAQLGNVPTFLIAAPGP